MKNKKIKPRSPAKSRSLSWGHFYFIYLIKIKIIKNKKIKPRSLARSRSLSWGHHHLLVIIPTNSIEILVLFLIIFVIAILKLNWELFERDILAGRLKENQLKASSGWRNSWPTDLPTDLPVKKPTDQPTNWPTNQPTNQLTHEPTDQPID